MIYFLIYYVIGVFGAVHYIIENCGDLAVEELTFILVVGWLGGPILLLSHFILATYRRLKESQ